MFSPDPVTELDNAIATARLLADEAGAPPPTVGDRFEIRRTLGRGASGLVCEAFDLELKRDVALKLVPLDGPRLAHVVQREAQTLAQFDHPNIVRIHSVGMVSEVAGLSVEVVYVEMQMIRGRNLRKWATERRRPEEVMDVLLAAGKGLAAAHALSFTHVRFPDQLGH